MRILHVCEKTSPRLYKIAMAQQGAGDTPIVLTKSATQEELAVELPLHPWGIRNTIRQWLDWADIVHAHVTLANPDMLPRLARFAGMDFAVCLDVHDMQDPTKVESLCYADSVVVPSVGYLQSLGSLDAPVSVIYSKAPKAWAKQGDNGDGHVAIVSAFADRPVFRDYTQVVDMVGEGYGIHAYSAGGDPPKGCASVSHLLSVSDLFTCLSKHTWGWAGASNDRHHIHPCVTNKFWDYLACGCAPITWRSAEMSLLMQDMYGYTNEWPTPRYLDIQPLDCLFMESELKKLYNAYDI